MSLGIDAASILGTFFALFSIRLRDDLFDNLLDAFMYFEQESCSKIVWQNRGPILLFHNLCGRVPWGLLWEVPWLVSAP